MMVLFKQAGGQHTAVPLVTHWFFFFFFFSCLPAAEFDWIAPLAFLLFFFVVVVVAIAGAELCVSVDSAVSHRV